MTRSIDDHFYGKNPRLRLLFQTLLKHLKRSGPLRIDAVKSTINLISLHHFGAVSVRHDFLRVGFILDRRIQDARVSHTEQVGTRFGHHVLVRSLNDIDARLRAWLAEAQSLQSGNRKRRLPASE
jgi:hypothetical protein